MMKFTQVNALNTYLVFLSVCLISCTVFVMKTVFTSWLVSNRPVRRKQVRRNWKKSKTTYSACPPFYFNFTNNIYYGAWST